MTFDVYIYIYHILKKSVDSGICARRKRVREQVFREYWRRSSWIAVASRAWPPIDVCVCVCVCVCLCVHVHVHVHVNVHVCV